MLTKKDLLTEGIVFPQEEEKSVMALPPEMGNKATSKKKKGLFSSPLFKESYHSNRLGLAIVSLGNALIMVIIITILSTLHINSTSSALANLFDNADYENTVKSGSISLYGAYSHTAESYETFLSGSDVAQKLFIEESDLVTDTTLNSSIKTAKVLYDTTYSLTSGDTKTKTATAKNVTMEAVEKTLENLGDLSIEEKEVSKSVISYYFDIYASDKKASTTSILKEAIPCAFEDVISSTYNLEEEKKEKTYDLFKGNIDSVYSQGRDKNEVSVENSLKLLPILATDTQFEFVKGLTDKLSQAYQTSKEDYFNDDSIKQDIISSSCQDEITSLLSDIAYYQYLPSFTVDYKTSDLGWPVRLIKTGHYGENGNEILEEIEVKIYNPSVYVKESEKMGKASNTLQKMRKKALTGEDYTEEEILEAKDKAKDSIEEIKLNLKDFMKSYLKRENGKNEYFDGTTILKDNIKDLAIKQVSAIVEKTLINAFNEKNDPDITSLEEITIQNSSMSGKEMISLVKGYASGGISSYDTYYSDYKKKGFSDVDCNLLSMNKASQGVMSMLPTSVNDSLKEMGEMNTYGIIVGVVSFGIAALLIPMVYTILLSKSLVSEKVETGSLAFTLSTPTTRNSFIFTQACYLIFSEIVMAVVMLIITLFARQIGIWAGSEDIATSLPVMDICFYALGNFMVCLAISGINFLTSCHFNKTSQSIGIGGGICIFFFICSILGLFATKAIPGTIRITLMSIFNYMTIDSLFDPLAVMSKDYLLYFFKLSFLLLITVVTYILGAIRFDKKDLPL